ncbi:MAG TPA: 2-amino-4-hydroxy-6-hydroxymethyldihydropteridine diphosphokinase [Puia sp.]|jgi:2-amino-4-hydroxy-6-hydroxymethyldihydropteridine diphosphokinase|nr:2-amino-4-hydroxy-6-hydroxymethyldihydropteridine diphosphokinase [Puia sp.]
MNIAYLLTGGNEGDRFLHMQQARTNIELICGQLLQVSSLYETEPWGNTDQPDFLNQVILIDTKLSPEELLRAILSIEKKGGRKRTVKNAPRTIDIDILFYNDLILEKPGLSIPHPRIADRRFVLEPLNEISPEFIHPVIGKTIHRLLLECKDELAVKKIG